MKTILAHNIDSKFWDIEFLAIDILKSIETKGQAIIHFNLEGPAFSETNLYQLFEYLKNVYKVDLSKITIQTGNVVEDNTKDYKVEIFPNWMYDIKEIQLILPKYQTSLAKNIDAKKFGIFIGRSNYPRLAIAGHMYSNYKDSTLITYHYENSSDFHKIHLGLEDLIHKFGINSSIVQNSLNLIKHSPILIEQNDSYPLSNPECYKILSWYSQFLIEIVCETYFKGDTFFLTEKISRALATKTPFIVQGPTDFLKRLKKIGFKTFDNWWDESYDEDPYDYKLNAILRIVDEINLLDINKVYKEMTPILDHNLEIFKNLNPNQFQKLLNE